MTYRLLLLLASVALLNGMGCTPNSQSDDHSKGHKTDEHSLTKTAEDESTPAAMAAKSGIDFKATGNEPAWILEIDFGKEIHFRTFQGDSARTPVPRPIREEPSGVVVYEATTEATKLRVSLQSKACTDASSGALADYTVAIQLNGKPYTGCGSYLFPALRLHDIWALEAVKGKAVAAASYSKGLPTLEIFPLEQRVQGHSGCNSLAGRVIVESDRIQFTDLLSTRMACPGNGEAEFLTALTATNGYRIDQLKLLLLTNGVEVLRLRKVD